MFIPAWLGATVALIATPAGAQEGDAAAELAKKLANPVSSLISVPFQFNYDGDIGPDDRGERWGVNIQPVIPISLNEDWNLISRTILPVVHQDEVAPGVGSQTGLGDTVQSFFFSPVEPVQGWIVGAGPVFLLPTGTDRLLTADKWGAGPTAVALKQTGPWTYGMLANHIWSFGGSGRRSDVDATFLQPFLSYTTPSAWTFTLNSEGTYDWEADDWAVPLNAFVSKLVAIGSQRVQLGAGLRYWAASSDGGPEGLGARLVVTLLFPR
jgi:hypothetical protein